MRRQHSEGAPAVHCSSLSPHLAAGTLSLHPGGQHRGRGEEEEETNREAQLDEWPPAQVTQPRSTCLPAGGGSWVVPSAARIDRGGARKQQVPEGWDLLKFPAAQGPAAGTAPTLGPESDQR